VAVTGREETIEIPTYEWGPEDPNPPFQRKGYWDIYPYTMMDDIGDRAKPVKYRAQVLENDYLKVIVLPQLGGHLYSVLDKPTGREIFYRNNVVKPGLIALRGAWISGGLEFNFPKGHSVTTVSPVDHRLVTEEDGSAVAWIGNLEKRYRMAWAVGIRLRDGSACIETEIRLSNRTALPHPYYFWANAAVPARFGMRMIYPCTKMRTWGGYFDWPVHEGRDMATYDSYDHGSDVFAMNGWEDFFGVYYPEWDFGIAHVADVRDAFGKKMFTWGTSEEGRMWSSILSDGDGPYCEIQSGRFADQSIYRLFPPHHTLQWTEWWYAIKGTGGFNWATKDAAVRLARNGNAVEYGVLVTRPMPGATVQLRARDRVVHEQTADLAPESPLHAKAKAAKGPLTIAVLEVGGVEVIRYQEAQPPRTIPLRIEPEAADPLTAGDLLRQAVHAEQRGDPAEARPRYAEALEKDPACVEAAAALGRITIAGDPSKAAELLSEAATRAPESATVAYYLGVALARAGRLDEAEPELSRAAHDPAFAHAARVELALLAMRRQDYQQAMGLLAEAEGGDAEDARAMCLLAAAVRRGGDPATAVEVLDTLSPAAALDRLALAERGFCLQALGKRGAAQQLKTLAKLLPDEADPWLELALDYLGAGLREEAIALLQEGIQHSKAAEVSPLVHYALASWLAQEGHDKPAEEHRGIAASLSPRYVLPYHWEMEAVLRDAVAANANDALAHSLLGTLRYSQGHHDEALAEWEAAARLGLSDFPVLFRNLGLGYREARHDLEAAEKWLRQAVAPAPDDLRPYLELNDVLRARKASPEDRLAVLDQAPFSVLRRGSMAAAQIDACLELGRWDRALQLLTTKTFHRWEGEFGMRRLWVGANLGRGAARFDEGDLAGAREDFDNALSYPENLRIGRQARRLDAHAHWCAGVACEALGDAEAAKQHWEEAAAELPHRHAHLATHHGVSMAELTVYRAVSLRKLGRGEEAETQLRELVASLRAHDEPNADAGHWFSLGLALKALGESGEAEAALRRSLELYPWRPAAARLLESDVVL
jgi:tetratricopeptide (TPR) repeat protein